MNSSNGSAGAISDSDIALPSGTAYPPVEELLGFPFAFLRELSCSSKMAWPICSLSGLGSGSFELASEMGSCLISS